MQEAAAQTGEAAASGKPQAAPAAKKMDIGVLAAISVAISSFTVILGTVLEKFFGLGYLMPLGLLGLLLLISGPAMLIAWMKLRQRNLGPILDANGWAVNTLTKVNIPLGTSLTELPKLPAGASRSLVDPYAEKPSPWPKVLLWLVVVAVTLWGLYRTNLLHKWLPDYVPAHHKEVSLLADKSSGFAGQVIVLTVRSTDDELEVYDAVEGGKLIAKAKVNGGIATLTIPDGMKAGVLVVRDSASPSEVTITVTDKPADPK